MFIRKRASKSQDLKNMLRKSPALNTWAAMFKNVNFPRALEWILALFLAFFSALIINGNTILFIKHGKADIICEVRYMLTYKLGNDVQDLGRTYYKMTSSDRNKTIDNKIEQNKAQYD